MKDENGMLRKRKKRKKIDTMNGRMVLKENVLLVTYPSMIYMFRMKTRNRIAFLINVIFKWRRETQLYSTRVNMNILASN